MKVVVIGNDPGEVARWRDFWKENGCEVINWFSSPDVGLDDPGNSWKRTIKNLCLNLGLADILFIANETDGMITPNTFGLMTSAVRDMSLGRNIRTIVCSIPKEGCCSSEVAKYIGIGYVEVASEVLPKILSRSPIDLPVIELVS